MVFLHIDKSNAYKNIKNSNSNSNLVNQLDFFINKPNNKVFILIYMEGCGPCMVTRPEWEKLKNVLHKKFLNRKDIIIVDIDRNVVENVKYIKSKPNSFPTIRFITNNGNSVENYEDSNIKDDGKYTIDSFVEWIKLKTGENNITTSEIGNDKKNKSSRRRRGNNRRSITNNRRRSSNRRNRRNSDKINKSRRNI
jgi:thiol-disulfide isomerase/thioredoxin